MGRRATYGTFLYALSMTFAGFDWVMSLNPHWFSTIFGICYFAGGFIPDGDGLRFDLSPFSIVDLEARFD